MSVDNPLAPTSLLDKAIKAVPAVKYAIGIGGIVAVIAIATAFGISLKIALFGTIVMIVLMSVLVVFASLAGQKSSNFHVPALIFTWFSLILVMSVAAVLFTSVFWGQPADLRNLLGVTTPDTRKTEPKQVVLQGPPLSPVPAAPNPVQGKELPSVTPRSKQVSATLHPRREKPVQGRPGHEIIMKEIDDNQAQVNESLANEQATEALAIIGCILSHCIPYEPAMRESEYRAAQDKWGYAVSGWKTALGETNDPERIARLNSKIQPNLGVTCDEHGECVSNGTAFHRYQSFIVPVSEFRK